MEMIYRLGWLLVEIIFILSFKDLVYCQGCEIELEIEQLFGCFPLPCAGWCYLLCKREVISGFHIQ